MKHFNIYESTKIVSKEFYDIYPFLKLRLALSEYYKYNIIKPLSQDEYLDIHGVVVKSDLDILEENFTIRSSRNHKYCNYKFSRINLDYFDFTSFDSSKYPNNPIPLPSIEQSNFVAYINSGKIYVPQDMDSLGYGLEILEIIKFRYSKL